jgi:hypothetical protein
MEEHHITNPKTNSFYKVWKNDDFENANPVEHFRDSQIKIWSSLLRTDMLLEMKKRGMPVDLEILDRVVLKKTSDEWNGKYQEYLNTQLPKGFFEALVSSSKKEQVKALKGLSLTSSEFIAFIIKAYLNYGYTLSQCISTHHHNGLDKSELPPFIIKEKDNSITSIGKTKLTDGQLKQAIDHRKVIVAKFLDKDARWHCFFLTYKSLKRDETAYKGGQPHLHFISDTWGISREEVVLQLTSKEYKLPALPHIDFDMER